MDFACGVSDSEAPPDACVAQMEQKLGAALGGGAACHLQLQQLMATSGGDVDAQQSALERHFPACAGRGVPPQELNEVNNGILWL